MLSVALFVVPLGVPLPHAHSLLGAGKQADLTNPEATQDAWPDCKAPDAKNNFYTDCTVTYNPKYEHRMAVVGSSETSGVGCPTKSCTWPAKLQDEIGTHGVQVVNLAAGATTITSVEHGGPSEIGYTYRPMYKALKTGEWDAVVFLFGGNDLKKDFWNKTNLATCKNGMDIDGCGFAQDYLKVIKEAQAAGRNGKKAEVFLFAPPTPGCCQLGARYVGSSASGCEYCKACASTQFAVSRIRRAPGRVSLVPCALPGDGLTSPAPPAPTNRASTSRSTPMCARRFYRT